MVAGIARPKLFFDFLKNETDETLVFPDHHHFSKQDCEQILAKANGRKIVTTEKDFVRLNGLFAIMYWNIFWRKSKHFRKLFGF